MKSFLALSYVLCVFFSLDIFEWKLLRIFFLYIGLTVKSIVLFSKGLQYTCFSRYTKLVSPLVLTLKIDDNNDDYYYYNKLISLKNVHIVIKYFTPS